MSRTAILLATLLLTVASGVAQACDTPVYRYAMYQWQTSPYEIYLFHDSELTAEQVELIGAIKKLEQSNSPRTNVTLTPVDLREPDSLQSIPTDVQRRWNEREEQALPAFLTLSPHGGLVSWQPLSVDSLEPLADSPARQQIAKELAAAKAGVLLVLTGADPAANQVAEQTVRQLAKQLESGEVELYRPPADELLGEGQPSEPDDAPQVAVVKIDRNDPAEQWLVDALLAVEGDLREIDQPMVFPLYGRARALPPFVGGGITTENLTAAVAFVTGACSCTVKDQNPGVDLLLTFDWNTAADAMKEMFGNEEGNEELSGVDLYPQLIIPGETNTDESPKPDLTTNTPKHQGEPLTSSATATNEPSPVSPAAEIALAAPTELSLSEAPSAAVAAETSVAAEETSSMLYRLGIGLGLGIVLLAVGTFFVFRTA